MEIKNTKKFHRNFWCARNPSISEHFQGSEKTSFSETFINNTSNNIKIFTFFIKINNINNELKCA